MGTDTILGSTDLVMSGVGGWFGGFDGLFHALVAFVVADYVSGVLAAVSERRLSSSAGFRGISRKILIFTFVCFAHVLDAYALGGSGAAHSNDLLLYLQRGYLVDRECHPSWVACTRLIIHNTAGGTDSSNLQRLSRSQNYGRQASVTYLLMET